jgi:hypothetical protein
MEELFVDPERPVSAWKLDSESRLYTGSPREVELVTSPLEADTVKVLQDPPLQINDIRDIYDGRPPSLTKELDTAALGYDDIKELRKTARPLSADPESRQRMDSALSERRSAEGEHCGGREEERLLLNCH